MRRFLINLLRIAVIAGNVLPFNAALAQAASRPDYRSAPPTEVLPAPNPFAPFAPAGGALEAFAPRPAPLLPPARPQPRPANVDTGYALTPGAALPRPAGLSLSKPAILNLARTAPAPVKGAEVLPSWFKTVPATEPAPPIFPLPEWFASIDQSQFSIINESAPPSPALANRASSNANPLLPEWFARPVNTARGVLPEWFAPPALPPAAPAARPLAADIPESLLSIEIFGPPAASVGAPAGFGEVYTAVIRNDSSSPPQTAYHVYLKALLPGFFIHDGGDSLISPTGSIPFNFVTGGSVITWTPVSTLNLAPGDVITLNFKLRTTCGVQSGQRMEIRLYYNADPTQPPVEFNTSGFNITTGRGNLVIKKEPAIQTLGTPDFGQPITWIVTVQNTGLGKIYSATVRDNGGVNLAAPSGTPALPDVIPLLDVNEVKTYTVVGVVESCNFTNEPEAYWSCGNLVNGAVKDGTITNPVSSTASVLFNPTLPNLSIEVSSPITFPYCSIVARTVSVTVTNTGGPAGDFRLDSGLESDGFLELVPGSVSAGWQYVAASGLFSYTGGSPTGTLAGGSVLTLSFDVRPQASACAAGNGDLTFTPLYRNICDSTPFTGTPVALRYEYARQNAPTLNIQKTGPDVVEPGGVYTYQIVISGTNPGSINGNVFVTDVLPSEFALQGILGASAGVAAPPGQSRAWRD
ncbi:MAG: hypothetical protein ACE5G8_07705, partial [Anaerolineae bacterium]